MTTNQEQIQENLATPNSPNVATTDENLSIAAMFQQTSVPSLAKQIFSILPLSGPTGAIFNISTKLDALGNTVADLLRAEVIVENSTSIPTGMTREAIDDIKAQYGKESSNIIGKLLRGLANDAENATLSTFLTSNSTVGTTLTRSAATNAEVTVFEVSQRVNELVLKMNSNHYRTYDSFAVLPSSVAAAFMGLSKYIGSTDNHNRGLFITQVGSTKYYVNSDPLDQKVYVGLKDDNASKSSAIFSPYMSDIITAVEAATGNETYHIFNRYALTMSPLHSVADSMLHSFLVV